MYTIVLRPIATMRVLAKRWLTRDRRYFFSRELRWTCRFLFAGQGLLWVAAFALLHYFNDYYSDFLRSLGPPTTYLQGWMFTILSRIPSAFILFTLWLVAFQVRSADVFRKEGFEQILTTGIGPRDLYPTILTAPVFALVIILLLINLPVSLYESWQYRIGALTSQSGDGVTLSMVFDLLQYYLVSLPSRYIHEALRWFVISLVAIRFVRYAPTWGRTAFAGLAASIGFYLVEQVVYMILFNLPITLTNRLNVQLGNFWQIYHIIVYSLGFLVAWAWISFRLLKRLRRQDDWERFVNRATGG